MTRCPVWALEHGKVNPMLFAKLSRSPSSQATVTSTRKQEWREMSTKTDNASALAYGNEKEVGQGIKDSGVPRSEIWVTTKLDNPWHKRVPDGIASSLKDLQLDYVDLYLMHWPSSSDPNNLKKHLEGWTFIDTW